MTNKTHNEHNESAFELATKKPYDGYAVRNTVARSTETCGLSSYMSVIRANKPVVIRVPRFRALIRVGPRAQPIISH